MDGNFRELRALQGDEGLRWSPWIIGMANASTPGTQDRKFIPRGGSNQVGYRNSNLANELQQAGVTCCGIYEWSAVKYEFYQDGRSRSSRRVVYVGSTCRRNHQECQPMQNRIVAYTSTGNHKKDLINAALERGWELWVRFKNATDEDQAKAMENALLGRYNYAWNIRNNGVRPILSRAVKWE
ncbi:uncharacterized protein LOC122962524 [Acropora millepora]|uniref:uncharacterized protein LOC122962524 n=1 Tax=Acropora millepora TaxID=45264 RepID=UPI001CF2DFE3|nr:uncharacterized protein LOC122962524 [Acropora millepora]